MGSKGRGCGTCKARRISCDRTAPVCLQCIRSKRTCQGYEMRLSWPRTNDCKRAIIGKSPTTKSLYPFSPHRMLHTSAWDIELHYYLSGHTTGCVRRLSAPFKWSATNTDTEYELLQYFISTASKSIQSVEPRPGSPKLTNILLRIALSNHGPSSTAVLHALLAVASVWRHGVQFHGQKLKVSALSNLAASVKPDMSADEIMSHVATLMLLCCFEIQQASETSSQWLWYISNVKSVIRAANIGTIASTSEMGTLMYWVSYHDVLAHFSVRYWRRRHSAHVEIMCHEDTDILTQQIGIYETVEISQTSWLCPSILRLLSEVFNLVVDRSVNRPREMNHKNLLLVLEHRIRNFAAYECPPLSGPEDLTIQVFQLALLVYLERTSGMSLRQSQEIEVRIERAFRLFERLETMERQFPVLILGCEARRDEDRVVVLDLIERTERRTGARSFRSTRRVLERLWAQDDLMERELGYTEKMRTILSSGENLLSFV